MTLNHFDRRTFLRVGSLTLFGHLSFAESVKAAGRVLKHTEHKGKRSLSDSDLVCRRRQPDGNLGPETQGR